MNLDPSSVIVAYRPDGSALGASAVFTTLGTAGLPTDPAFDDVLQAYQKVGEAAAFDAVPGIQIEVGKLFDA